MKNNLNKKRLTIAIALAIIAVLSTLFFVTIYATPITVGNFVVDYAIQSDWGNGASISVAVKNNGPGITGWTVGWTFPGNQKITNMWNANYTQSGATVTAKNLEYNASIPTNGSQNFGFNVSYSGSNTAPSSFTVNLATTNTPTPTLIISPSPTARVTPTVTRTATPTRRGSTQTPTRRATPTRRVTPSATPFPTVTTTRVPTPTATPTPTPWSLPPITNFMRASGTGFQNDFRFMGANLDPWRFNTAEGEVYSQAEIGLWVANAVQYTHARVIRMHINGGAFEPSVGTYGEPAFKQLDYLLAEAAKNNVYVLISLRDYCWGPWPPDGCYDSYWYMHGGTPASPKKDNILIESDTIAAFKNFISYVVNRVNTVTGVTYKNDPHILGWEIINEPNMISGIKNWFMDISSFLKSVDSNHMVGVATGDLSSSAWWGPGSSSWNDLNIPQFDFLSIHYYGDYYDPSNTDWVSRWNQVLQTVKTLGKPVIVDEFGLPSNFELSKLINFHQTIITSSLNAGLPGVMPYSWGPPGPNYWGDSGSFCYYTDDPSLCDLLKGLAP